MGFVDAEIITCPATTDGVEKCPKARFLPICSFDEYVRKRNRSQKPEAPSISSRSFGRMIRSGMTSKSLYMSKFSLSPQLLAIEPRVGRCFGVNGMVLFVCEHSYFRLSIRNIMVIDALDEIALPYLRYLRARHPSTRSTVG